MAVLALFQPDAQSRARLTDALRDHHHLVPCESWTDLWERMRRQPVDGCIVDPYNTFDPLELPELLHFRKRFSTTALVVYGDFAGREMDLYHLGRMGVDGVILAGRSENLRALRERVELSLSSWLAKRVADALEGTLPPLAIRCLRWSIAHAEDCPQVPDLARVMRMSSRALSRELRARGLPSPRHVLLWGRLFQAARMLSASDATVEEVAYRLGYATGASLGRAFKEQLDLPPSAMIDHPEGLERVLDAFLSSLDEPDGPPRRWSTREARKRVLASFDPS